MISRFGALVKGSRPILSAITSRTSQCVTASPKLRIIETQARQYSTTMEAPAVGATITPETPVAEAKVNGAPQTRLMDSEILSNYNSADKSSWTAVNFEEVLRQIRSDLSSALEIFYQMKEMNIQPSQNIYSNLMRVALRSLTIRDIATIFTEKIPVNSNGLSATFEAAQQIYNMAKSEGLVFEDFVYERVSMILKNRRQVGWLKQFIEMLQRNGVSPSTKIYNNLMQAYATVPNVEMMKSLYARMMSLGKGDFFTETAMLLGYSKSGSFAEMEQLFEKLSVENPAESSVYNICMSAYLGVNDVARALSLYQTLKSSECPANPSIATYSILGNYFLMHEYPLELKQLVEDYVADSACQVDSDLMALMVRCSSRIDASVAANLYSKLKEMSPQSVELYNTCLSIVNDVKIGEDAKKAIFELLIEKNYSMPENGLISPFLSNTSLRERGIIYALESNNVSPTTVTFDILMRSLLYRKDYQNSNALFEKMIEKKIKFSQSTINLALSTAIQTRSEDAINRCVNMFKFNNYSINANNKKKLQAHYGPERAQELFNF